MKPSYSREQIELALGILSGRIDPERMWGEDKAVLHGLTEGFPLDEYNHRRQAESIVFKLLTGKAGVKEVVL